jgi:Na+-transporting methylmalonyl-CoA/oxaloacetate decarboxylase gamma subunit
LDQALLLTGVGMGLVFLALALVMAVIAVLERIFRPAAKAGPGTTAALIPPMAVAAPAAAAAPAAGEAAAIAVALDQRKRNEVAAIAAAILMQAAEAVWRQIPLPALRRSGGRGYSG